MNTEIINGLILIFSGCIGILFRNYFAKNIIEAQNRAWGFNFGEKDILISRIVIVIVGFFSIVIPIPIVKTQKRLIWGPRWGFILDLDITL